MNEFKVIVIMNEAMIKTLKDKNSNYEENLKIQKYLEDESIFFKLNKVDAYQILKSVGVRKESLEEVYKKLISQTMFYDLLIKGKIDTNDSDLVVKYSTYDSDNLFNKRK